jgi:hypothetical protein
MKRILSTGLIVALVVFLLLTGMTVSAMTTRQTAVDWVKAQANSEVAYDVDGIYGYQCSDFATAYINYLIDGNAWSQGYTTYNGYQYFDISYPNGWQRIDNYDSFVPEPGDILVFSGTNNNPNGHVCVAIEGCTTTVYNAVGQDGSQNWRGAHYQTGAYFDAWNSFRGVIRPLFNNPTPKPTTATTSIAKTVYTMNENVTFNFTSDTTVSYTIGIDKDSTRIETQVCTNPYSRSFSDPGNYSAYVTAWNSAGNVDSNRVSFTVAAKPGAPNLSVAKATNNSVDEVNFSWGATSDTSNYDLRIFKNGTVVNTLYGISGTSSSIQLATGSYTAFLCSVNTAYSDWWTKGNTIDFNVISTPTLDLGNVTWAKNQIQTLVDNGVICGKSKTDQGIMFAPEDQITRGEFTALIVKAFSISGSGKDASFGDVASDAWYYNVVGAAFKDGIIKGTSDKTFEPNAPIDRQDMVTLFMRAMVKYQSKTLVAENLINQKVGIFNDAENIADYAKSYVATAVDLGIIKGINEDGLLKFNPRNNTNRAEAAVTIFGSLPKA